MVRQLASLHSSALSSTHPDLQLKGVGGLFEVGNGGVEKPNTGCPSSSGQLVSGHMDARKREKSEKSVTFINIKIHT